MRFGRRDSLELPNRIVLSGGPSCGKTTIANKLADLDNVFRVVPEAASDIIALLKYGYNNELQGVAQGEKISRMFDILGEGDRNLGFVAFQQMIFRLGLMRISLAERRRSGPQVLIYDRLSVDNIAYYYHLGVEAHMDHQGMLNATGAAFRGDLFHGQEQYESDMDRLLDSIHRGRFFSGILSEARDVCDFFNSDSKDWGISVDFDPDLVVDAEVFIFSELSFEKNGTRYEEGGIEESRQIRERIQNVYGPICEDLWFVEPTGFVERMNYIGERVGFSYSRDVSSGLGASTSTEVFNMVK